MRATTIQTRWPLWLVAATFGCAPGCFDAGKEVDHRDTGSIQADVGQQDAPVASDSGDDAGQGCAEGRVDCNGQCVDLASSTDHCGSCDSRCEALEAHTVASCVSGSCVQKCEAGWTDLDGDPTTGCELACAPTEGGEEICDGVDNDCNGTVDDGFSTGACTVGVGACEKSGQYVCADAQTSACSVSAGEPADELCGDAIDNDCDGEVDEDEAHDAPVWFGDSDADGFGDSAVTTKACENPGGYVDNPSDCDDTSAGVNPGADEVCDQIDNNCDGSTDDASASDAALWYVDCDGDGFSADTAGLRTSCEMPSVAPNGCSAASATWTHTRPSGGSSVDCNDEVAQMFPGQTGWFDAPVTPNSVHVADWDYNCDGTTEYRWTATNASCAADPFTQLCNGTAGWVDANIMFCGSQNSYQNCTGARCGSNGCTSVCDDSVVTRTQTCR